MKSWARGFFWAVKPGKEKEKHKMKQIERERERETDRERERAEGKERKIWATTWCNSFSLLNNCLSMSSCWCILSLTLPLFLTRLRCPFQQNSLHLGVYESLTLKIWSTLSFQNGLKLLLEVRCMKELWWIWKPVQLDDHFDYILMPIVLWAIVHTHAWSMDIISSDPSASNCKSFKVAIQLRLFP